MEMEKLLTYHLISKGENDTPINNKCDCLRLSEVRIGCCCSGWKPVIKGNSLALFLMPTREMCSHYILAINHEREKVFVGINGNHYQVSVKRARELMH